MNLPKILIVFFLLACLSQAHAQQHKDGISYNQPFVSPDKRFDAQLVSILYPSTFDRHPTQPSNCLAIIDTEKKNTAFVLLFTPVYAVNFTGDSKSIVTVEHLAGGSECVVLHYADGLWQRHEIEPPDNLADDSHYAVVERKVDENSVTVTYKVLYDPGDGSKRQYFVYTFIVDAATGKTTKVISKREIDGGTYRELPMVINSVM